MGWFRLDLQTTYIPVMSWYHATTLIMRYSFRPVNLRHHVDTVLCCRQSNQANQLPLPHTDFQRSPGPSVRSLTSLLPSTPSPTVRNPSSRKTPRDVPNR